MGECDLDPIYDLLTLILALLVLILLLLLYIALKI